MKTAIVSAWVAGALGIAVAAGLPAPANAEEPAAPGGAVTPLAPPRAVPKPLLPERRAPAQDAESSQPEAPSQGPGCPDQGRKLQLIV